MAMLRQIETQDVLRLLRFNYCWVFLAIMVLFLSLSKDTFATGENWQVIIRSVSVTGLYALGNSFVFLGGGVDVSIISIGAATSMVYGRLFHIDGVSTHAALTVAVLFSAALGLANGLLVAKARIAPFITTLATQSIMNGISERVSGGNSIFELGELATPPDNFFGALGRGTVGAFPVQVIIFLGVGLGSFLLLAYTVFGNHLYAAGANPRAARLSGVNVDRMLISTYVLCALFAGVAGMIRASDTGVSYRQGATLYSQGPGLLDSIGAVLIGGTALSGGIGSIQGTIGGSMVLGVLSNGLYLYAAPLWARNLSLGAVVIAAVAIGVLLGSGIFLEAGSIPERLALLRARAMGALWRRPARL